MEGEAWEIWSRAVTSGRLMIDTLGVIKYWRWDRPGNEASQKARSCGDIAGL